MEHIRRSEPIACNLCSLSFETIDLLKEHTFQSHILPDQYIAYRLKCSQCSKVFEHFKHLIKHLKVHNSIGRFKCILNKCGEECDSIGELRWHLKDHRDIEKTIRSCELCAKAFRSRDILRKHLLNVHRNDSRIMKQKFECCQCNETFVHPKKLWQHMTIHNGVGTFKCSYSGCYDAFDSCKELRWHLEEHLGGDELQQKNYAYERLLQRCGIQQHTCVPVDRCGEFVCDLCGKVYRWLSLIKEYEQSYWMNGM